MSTVRSGMTNLIARLRAMTHAGPDDYSLADTTFWTDTHLQALLDRTRCTRTGVPLDPLPIIENGTVRVYEYGFPFGRHFEEAGPGSGWAVRDARGQAVLEALYTVNYEARRITFEADQACAAYFLDVRTYNLNATAADVWDQKAAFVAASLDWEGDNHAVRASQEYAHCMAMATHFRQLAGVKVSRLLRVDDPAWE